MLVISLVALLLSKYLQCVCITFIIRKDNCKEKRLFSLRSEVLLWSGSSAPQLGALLLLVCSAVQWPGAVPLSKAMQLSTRLFSELCFKTENPVTF